MKKVIPKQKYKAQADTKLVSMWKAMAIEVLVSQGNMSKLINKSSPK